MNVKAFLRKLTDDPGLIVLAAGGPGAIRGHRGSSIACAVHLERTRWDPKDGELCLARAKPGETLVEARLDSDVQIDPQSWV
jgi:hypothetical protein